jgi:hypothetical protein
MPKFIKYVDYQKSYRQGDKTPHPVITVRVKGYNKLLNAPRHQVKRENIQPLILGF